MPASSLFVEALAVRRGISVWRRFFSGCLPDQRQRPRTKLLSILSDTSTIYRPRCGSSSSAAA
jgi:hypothetical protein